MAGAGGHPVVSSTIPSGPLVDREGRATFGFLKWLQGVGTTVNGAFDSAGNYQGPIGEFATIDGRETLARIVQNIDTNGVVESSGIDFARIYENQNIDYIADGEGSPIAGGKEAYELLVASAPVSGQTIRFNGLNWGLVAIAVSKVDLGSQWLKSYNAGTGIFTSSQPGFTDISGAATAAQLPADLAYKSQPNVFTVTQTFGADINVTGTAIVGNNIACGAGGIHTTGTLASDGGFFTNSGISFVTGAGAAAFTSLAVSGSKSFVIPHPLDEEKDLHHSCLEGPENGVFYRGEIVTVDGEAEVMLPDYFEALTFAEDRSVLLTVIVDDDNPVFGGQVAAGRIRDGKFRVYSTDASATIAWEVKAVRKVGVEKLIVMADREESDYARKFRA